MATGAPRMARKHSADLFPTTIHVERPWQFVVQIGAPVPEQILRSGDATAGRDLLDKMMPILEQHPDQWTTALSSRFLHREASTPAAVHQ
jgi:lauroyl/myristoyl acyltransferase